MRDNIYTYIPTQNTYTPKSTKRNTFKRNKLKVKSKKHLKTSVNTQKNKTNIIETNMSAQIGNSSSSAISENPDQKMWSNPNSNSIGHGVRSKLWSSHSDYSLTEVFCAMLCALFGSITVKPEPKCMDDLTSKGCQTQSSFFSPMKILRIAEELPPVEGQDNIHEYKSYNDIYDKDSNEFKFLDPMAFTYDDKENLIFAIDNGTDLDEETRLKLTLNMAFVTDYMNWLIELTVVDFAALIRGNKLHVKHSLSRRCDRKKEGNEDELTYLETEEEFENRLETKINELALSTMLECQAWCHGMGRLINMLCKEKEEEEDKTKCFENDENNLNEVYFSSFKKCKMHPLNIVCDAITSMKLDQIQKMERALRRSQTTFQIGDVTLQQKYRLFENNDTTVDKFSIQKMLPNALRNAFLHVEHGNMAPHLFTRSDKKRMWFRIKSGMSKQCILASEAGFNVNNIFASKRKSSGKRKRADATALELSEAKKKIKQTDIASQISNYLCMNQMFIPLQIFIKYRAKPLGMKIVQEACLDRETVTLQDGLIGMPVTTDEVIAWNTEFQKRKAEEPEEPEEEEEEDSSSGSEDGNIADANEA